MRAWLVTVAAAAALAIAIGGIGLLVLNVRVVRVPVCGRGATLILVDAHTGASLLVVSLGHPPSGPPPDFGCG